MLLVLLVTPRVFLQVLWFSSLPKNQHSKFQLNWETVNKKSNLMESPLLNPMFSIYFFYSTVTTSFDKRWPKSTKKKMGLLFYLLRCWYLQCAGFLQSRWPYEAAHQPQITPGPLLLGVLFKVLLYLMFGQTTRQVPFPSSLHTFYLWLHKIQLCLLCGEVFLN